MDYLYQRNRWVARELGPDADASRAAAAGSEITAAGKDVVVIGGGDTGADCVGNALREGARSIVQLELLPRAARAPPRRAHAVAAVAGQVPPQLRDGGGDRGARRRAGLLDHHDSLRAGRRDGGVAALRIAQAAPEPPFAALAGSERELPAQLVLLAMGFLGPERSCSTQLGVERDARGNVNTQAPYTTSVPGVFAAGDARRGQSLIVWAINEGRQCARMVDRYLSSLTARAG